MKPLSLLFDVIKEPLALYEIERLLKPLVLKKKKEYFYVEIKPAMQKYISRLAYTNAVYRILFTSNKKDLHSTIGSFSWQRHYKKNFAVRTHGFAKEKELAPLIYHKLKEPKVKLKNPQTLFEFFKFDNYYATKCIWVNDKSFLKRKPHLRPSLHPTSLNPRLAKATINCALRSGTLLDPFCGSGGILVEASLAGIKCIGSDIDKIMLKRAKINLSHYNCKNYTLKLADATTIKQKCSAIVTDVPYGKNTKDISHDLYLKFLLHAQTITKIMVIMFPDHINFKKLIKQTNWQILKIFDHYLHKGLTKKIVVLELN